jgi:hypothetical protein
MRKRTVRRLVLTRETLRALESESLRGARGGFTGQPATCNASCATDVSCAGATCRALCQTNQC